ncbi:hypothetical protein K2173_024469 [Erythroxylum novogranatense]|uniref:Uncharacterized protein n=1 Tax=Erythroxylum novogranatense TaxID=1862640 RepID=A0AAV8SVP0_9ROSI|nr:hypothetical protein K2173_024469 [Erythroxylum novogranatense]
MADLEIAEHKETLKQSDEPATVIAAAEHQVGENCLQDLSSSSSVYEHLMFGRPWTTGLFDCQEDRRNAIITAFFPCVTFGQIAEVLSEGNTSCRSGCLIYFSMMLASYSQWIMSTEYRTKLRKKHDLEEGPCTDVASHIFCPCCSLCQEFRELKNRGFDPALGWSKILVQELERREHDQLVTAPQEQVMTK